VRRLVFAGIVVGGAIGAAGADAPLSPEDTVRKYLSSLKAGDFATAYDLVSTAMRGGKEKEVWVKEQKAGMAFADVKIFDTQVFPGKVEGEKAFVPNVLSSQDRFVNQLGLTEYELYTLVKEGGAWKVDQQLIVEPPDVPKWFPKGKGGAEAKPSGTEAKPPSH
jgi:hypothetical protein